MPFASIVTGPLIFVLSDYAASTLIDYDVFD